MLSERGEVIISTVVVMVLVFCAGFYTAEVRHCRELLKGSGWQTICVFGPFVEVEVNDVAPNLSSVPVLAPDEAPPGGAVPVSVVRVEGVSGE